MPVTQGLTRLFGVARYQCGFFSKKRKIRSRFMSFPVRALFCLFLLVLSGPSPVRGADGFLFASTPQLRIVFAAETRGYLHPCAT